MRTRLHGNIFNYGTVLLAFFIPVLPPVLPIIIFLLILNWIVSGVWIRTIPLFGKETWRPWTLAFTLLYWFYAIGLLYSDDMGYGWFDLEVKLSLLIFPLILSTTDRKTLVEFGLKPVLAAFVAGCLAGSVILLIRALTVNVHAGIPDPIYYTNLSWYFHPSYLAMYFTFATGIILWQLGKMLVIPPDRKIWILGLTVLYLEWMIILLSSKAGLLVLALIFFCFIWFLFRLKATRRVIWSLILFLSVSFIGLAFVFPYAFGRISKAETAITVSGYPETHLEDGTVARLQIWKIAAGIIRDHPLAGVGTGDVKVTLQNAYNKHQLEPVARKMLNAHNQYLQTAIALGLPGFILLAASILVPFLLPAIRKNVPFGLLALIFGVNILFESMLEVQAGVIFYAFFNSLLFIHAYLGSDKQIQGDS